MATNKRLIISYDFKKQTYEEPPKFISNMGREKMIIFLLSKGGKNLKSYTDSTIHFTFSITDAVTELAQLFSDIKTEFPKISFSLTIMATTFKNNKFNPLGYAHYEPESTKDAGDGLKNLFDKDLEKIIEGLKE